MNKVLFFLAAFLLAARASAFAPTAADRSRSNERAISELRMSDDAQVLSDYMTKSHEEKLRAVKEVEDRKNSEIAALKAEIQQLKSNPALPAATNVIFTSSASDAESKLASYQQFMSEYIVNAQNQKLLAVREAELKAEKKFQERLEMLLSASGVSLPPSDVVNTQSSKQLSLYQKRNLKVAAAGEAGKSRWGSLELQKVNEYVKSPAAAISTQSKEGNSIFDQRNARILAAAAAGKSRWGNMEVERAKNSGISTAKSATAAAPTPAKTATLEDRVNLGARLLGV